MNKGMPSGVAIKSLAIDPVSHLTVYAGTQDSGLYKTTNGGVSWASVNTGLTDTDVVSLAIHPGDHLTLYAGTFGGKVFKTINGGGEFGMCWITTDCPKMGRTIHSPLIRPIVFTVYAGSFGGGMFKTMNAGASWDWLHKGLPYDGGITSIAIDPANHLTVYASGDGNVFKTTDGGANWSAVRTGLDGLAYPLAIDPTNHLTLYVGTYGNGVFKTVNGASASAEEGYYAEDHPGSEAGATAR